MDVKRFGLWFLLVLSVVLLGACEWPEPACSVANLVQPIPSGPVHNQTEVALMPSILWSYGAGYECQPDGFVLQIAHDQLFNDMVLEAENAAFDTSWTATTALDPATEYWWRVAGGMGSSGSLSLGPWSERQRFFTGPTCAASSLVAPIPLSPPDGGIMDEEWGPVYFDYPLGEACLPEFYRMLLSTSPDFSDPSLNGWIPHPAEGWGPGDAYLDCTTYYWSAVPVVGSTEGPGSPTMSFYVDLTGSCPPTASITGLVWHDLCAVPYESTTIPNPGCTMLPGGGMAADGIYDPAEPGIAGITVDLGAGPCPAAGLATAVTQTNGSYTFPGLTMGDYCVSVDPLAHGNDLVLIPGGWTFPDRDVTIAEHDVSLGMGTPAEYLFGWDYQFLPAPEPAPSPTPVYYSLAPFIDANCRRGPDLSFEAVGFLLEGELAEVNARNMSNTWWRVYLPAILGNCWISDATVEIDFDPSGLPIVVLPTPTPVPPVCRADMGQAECEAAGGFYVVGGAGSVCQCP